MATHIFDLDGTLLKHHTNEWLPGAKEMLFELADKGDQIIFITVRGPQDAGREWSVENTVRLLEKLPFQHRLITYCTRPRFLYDDDPGDLRDERGILLGDARYDPSAEYPWIPSGGWINAGTGWRFNLQQFEPFVFEEHVIEAINGRNNQWDAAHDLVAHADKVTRFDYPRYLTTSWAVLHPPGGDDRNQCSNIAALLTAFNRAAGIPARPFFTDWVSSSFDRSRICFFVSSALF